MGQHFTRVNDVNIEALSPITAFGLIHTPRVSLVFHGPIGIS